MTEWDISPTKRKWWNKNPKRESERERVKKKNKWQTRRPFKCIACTAFRVSSPAALSQMAMNVCTYNKIHCSITWGASMLTSNILTTPSTCFELFSDFLARLSHSMETIFINIIVLTFQFYTHYSFGWTSNVIYNIIEIWPKGNWSTFL